MNAARAFGEKSEIVSLLPPRVVYKLAAPSTPSHILAEVVQRLDGGEKLTDKAISSMIRDALPVRKRTNRHPSVADADGGMRPDDGLPNGRASSGIAAIGDGAADEGRATAERIAKLIVPCLEDGVLERLRVDLDAVDPQHLRTALLEELSRRIEQEELTGAITPTAANDDVPAPGHTKAASPKQRSRRAASARRGEVDAAVLPKPQLAEADPANGGVVEQVAKTGAEPIVQGEAAPDNVEPTTRAAAQTSGRETESKRSASVIEDMPDIPECLRR